MGLCLHPWDLGLGTPCEWRLVKLVDAGTCDAHGKGQERKGRQDRARCQLSCRRRLSLARARTPLAACRNCVRARVVATEEA